MYGIDINFLNDRADRPIEGIVAVDQSKASAAGKVPMLVGVAVAFLACGGVGGYWFLLQNQQKSLIAQSAGLDAQLGELQQKIAQVDTVRQQTQVVDAEVQALATVFERIRPWSAIVRDVQSRIPTRTQLSGLVQTAPVEGGSAAGGLTLTGNACSFNDVNDFLLTLKTSPFLEAASIDITSASLGEPVVGYCPGGVDNGKTLSLVTYTITADIKSISATALLDELNRQQESTGLAARILALQSTGAI